MVEAHSGRCLCGAVEFVATGEALRIVHCHCESCRRQTGASVATFAGFKRSTAFTWSRGEPTAYHSSPKVRRSFCRACGSPLSYESDDYDDEIYLMIGAFDEPHRLLPQAHVHVSEKISWIKIADGLPQFAGNQPEGTVPEHAAMDRA